jgi:hypothetical protein
MTRLVKWNVLALLAVIAAMASTGISSASASTECEAEAKPGSGIIGLCVEGKWESGGARSEGAFTTKLKPGTVSVLALRQYGNDKIECKAAGGSGYLGTGEKEIGTHIVEYTPTFSECVLTGINKSQCTARPSSVWFRSGGTFSPGISSVGIRGEGSEYFGSYTVENAKEGRCPTGLVGTHNLRRVYECKLPEIGVLKLEHEMICSGEPFTFESEESTLLTMTQMISLSGLQAGKKFYLFEAR